MAWARATNSERYRTRPDYRRPPTKTSKKVVPTRTSRAPCGVVARSCAPALRARREQQMATGKTRDPSGFSCVDAWHAGCAIGRRMPDDRVTPSPAVRASVSADGLVLLDVDGGLILTSNAIGARIWQLLEQRLTSAEIANDLVRHYAIASDVAQRDVRAFVSDLLARGLLIEEEPC
jgi:hypothetical protein